MCVVLVVAACYLGHLKKIIDWKYASQLKFSCPYKNWTLK